MGDFLFADTSIPAKWSGMNMANKLHYALGFDKLTQLPPPGEGDFIRYDDREDDERGDAGSRWSFFDFRNSYNKPTEEDIAYAEAIEAQEKSNQQARIDLDASLSRLYEEEEKRKREARLSQLAWNDSFEAPL